VLILCLPPSRAPKGDNAARHRGNEVVDERIRDATPAVFQSRTKRLPMLRGSSVIVELRVELVHQSFQAPPEVLDRVEIR
jgi:hypothetical protein